MTSTEHLPVLRISGTGPALVLLHCLGVDQHFWDFADELERDYTLLRYDLPGHGTSPLPQQPYSIEDLSAQLGRLLRDGGFQKAHVAGISLGGLIAQHCAATNPQTVDRLILIDTTPRYVDELRHMWGVRAKTAREEGVSALIDGLLKIWFSDEAVARNVPSVQYVRAALARSSGEGYALACEALASADLREDASRIRAPTLIICGDNDIASFLDAARWLEQNIAQATLKWIPGTRHASVIEKPEHAIRLLRDFLTPAV
jgi:3-oxoadipate enol-lactonase